MDLHKLQKLIEDAWENRQLLEYKEHYEAVKVVIDKLDKGELRVAEPIGTRWHVNDWIKKADILYFPIQEMKEINNNPIAYQDKMELKKKYKTHIESDDRERRGQ